jgi:hypothetical protein
VIWHGVADAICGVSAQAGADQLQVILPSTKGPYSLAKKKQKAHIRQMTFLQEDHVNIKKA